MDDDEDQDEDEDENENEEKKRTTCPIFPRSLFDAEGVVMDDEVMQFAKATNEVAEIGRSKMLSFRKTEDVTSSQFTQRQHYSISRRCNAARRRLQAARRNRDPDAEKKKVYVEKGDMRAGSWHESLAL